MSAQKQQPDVAFMFLGGLPVPKTDAGRAWKNWIMHANKHSPALFNKIMFVTHPISRDDTIIKDVAAGNMAQDYWAKFLGSRILFVGLTKPEEHLRTAWATRSLVDATILMMRAADKATSGAVKKFILIDKTTCPLYSLKALYNAVTANDKNWFDAPLHNKCSNLLSRYQADKDAAAAANDGSIVPGLSCPKHDPSACLKKSDCSFWSQWWVIDRRYVSVILEASLVKSEKTATCGSSEIDLLEVPKKQQKSLANRIMANALGAFGSGGDTSACVPSDEMFFHVLMKRQFKDTADFLKTMNLIKLDQFKTSVKSIVTVPLKIVNVDPVFQLKNSIEGGLVYTATIINQDFSWGSKDVDIKVHPKHSEPGFEKFIFSATWSPQNYYDRWRSTYGRFPFYVNPIYILDKLVSDDAVPLCSTYTDWRYVNPNPFNIFRSFSWAGYYFAERNPDDAFNVNSYAPQEFIELLGQPEFDDMDRDLEPITFQNLGMSHVPFYSHPMEYNTNHLYAYMNAHNLLAYFNALNRTRGFPADDRLVYFENVYDNILKNMGTSFDSTKVRYVKTDYQILDERTPVSATDLNAQELWRAFEMLMGIQRPAIDTGSTEMTCYFYTIFNLSGDKITIPRIGVPVNAEILNGARMRGALFLRKCENGSYMHAYSQQLFADDQYLYQDLLVS